MGVLPEWGLQIWAVTRLAQMAWCSRFLPCIPEEWRAPVEPLESLDGWMPALAPTVPDGNSSWGLMDHQQQVMGAADPRNAFPAVLSPPSAQIAELCGLPWAGQLHSRSRTLLYHKKPAGELQMVFILIESFVQHKRGGTGQGICPADFGTYFHLLN